jgi:hypothetical protein
MSTLEQYSETAHRKTNRDKKDASMADRRAAARWIYFC